MASPSHHVVVLGASPDRSRFSNRAVRLLVHQGFLVTPVHPSAETVEGLAVVHELARVARPVHTLTLYLRPERLARIRTEVLGLESKRVIFNPGTEYPKMEAELTAAGAAVVRGCTLIMLRDGSF